LQKLPNFGTLAKIFESMGKNTSISLGNHFETFVETSISKGRFQNASEVIRAGLRLLEEEENKIFALRTAIEEGIESGQAAAFDPKKHLELLQLKKKNG
jgi:antitoxin ParD1/3/4